MKDSLIRIPFFNVLVTDEASSFNEYDMSCASFSSSIGFLILSAAPVAKAPAANNNFGNLLYAMIPTAAPAAKAPAVNNTFDAVILNYESERKN